MTKYNLSEKKERDANYCTLVSPAILDELKERIIDVVVIQKKFKDKNYTAQQLAKDLGTNTRYVSAVVNVRFRMNYSTFINKYRIEEAMSILTDKRFEELHMEEVSDMVGFCNRQSFYASFHKFTGLTPKEYRTKYLVDDKQKKKEEQNDDVNS